jgi:hypothetical protein
MATTKQQIDSLEKNMNSRFQDMNKKFESFEKEVRGQIAPLHDYVVGQKAVAKNKGAPFTLSENIGVPKDVVNIIKWLVLIIGSIVGIKNI